MMKTPQGEAGMSQLQPRAPYPGQWLPTSPTNLSAPSEWPYKSRQEQQSQQPADQQHHTTHREGHFQTPPPELEMYSPLQRTSTDLPQGGQQSQIGPYPDQPMYPPPYPNQPPPHMYPYTPPPMHQFPPYAPQMPYNMNDQGVWPPAPPNQPPYFNPYPMQPAYAYGPPPSPPGIPPYQPPFWPPSPSPPLPPPYFYARAPGYFPPPPSPNWQYPPDMPLSPSQQGFVHKYPEGGVWTEAQMECFATEFLRAGKRRRSV
jgi:hypothetical protein